MIIFIEGKLIDAKKGAIVVVNVFEKKHAICVGRTTMSSKDMYSHFAKILIFL